MLTKDEVCEGALYAWDCDVIEPDVGCNLWTIIDDRGYNCLRSFNFEPSGIIIIKSIDGNKIQRVGMHCLIPADRALRRLKALTILGSPLIDYGTYKQWKCDKEIKYLTLFKKSYDTYKNQNCASFFKKLFSQKRGKRPETSITLSQTNTAIEYCEEIINSHDTCESCIDDHKKLKAILEYAKTKLIEEIEELES